MFSFFFTRDVKEKPHYHKSVFFNHNIKHYSFNLYEVIHLNIDTLILVWLQNHYFWISFFL